MSLITATWTIPCGHQTFGLTSVVVPVHQLLERLAAGRIRCGLKVLGRIAKRDSFAEDAFGWYAEQALGFG